MILLFNKNGEHVLSCLHIPSSHQNDDYIAATLPEGEIYEYGYVYTLKDGVAIKGDLIQIDYEELSKIESEIALLAYRSQRSNEYPSIGDQLDALFHAGLFPEEMASQIQSVKDKYPKPE